METKQRRSKTNPTFFEDIDKTVGKHWKRSKAYICPSCFKYNSEGEGLQCNYCANNNKVVKLQLMEDIK